VPERPKGKVSRGGGGQKERKTKTKKIFSGEKEERGMQHTTERKKKTSWERRLLAVNTRGVQQEKGTLTK